MSESALRWTLRGMWGTADIITTVVESTAIAGVSESDVRSATASEDRISDRAIDKARISLLDDLEPQRQCTHDGGVHKLRVCIRSMDI